MSTDLVNGKCVPCHGDIAPMAANEAMALLPAVPGWELIDDASKLKRTFTFANFMQAQAFALQTGNIAEAENHHPDISYGWGYCTVVFYTHKIGGLHKNDFIMATRVNEVKCKA